LFIQELSQQQMYVGLVLAGLMGVCAVVTLAIKRFMLMLEEIVLAWVARYRRVTRLDHHKEESYGDDDV
jgi:hypothetical protein